MLSCVVRMEHYVSFLLCVWRQTCSKDSSKIQQNSSKIRSQKEAKRQPREESHAKAKSLTQKPRVSRRNACRNALSPKTKGQQRPSPSYSSSCNKQQRVIAFLGHARKNARRNALSPKTKGQQRVIAFLEVGCTVEEQVGCAVEEQVGCAVEEQAGCAIARIEAAG